MTSLKITVWFLIMFTTLASQARESIKVSVSGDHNGIYALKMLELALKQSETEYEIQNNNEYISIQQKYMLRLL